MNLQLHYFHLIQTLLFELLSIILAASGHESDIPTSLKEPNSSVYLGYC